MNVNEPTYYEYNQYIYMKRNRIEPKKKENKKKMIFLKIIFQTLSVFHTISVSVSVCVCVFVYKSSHMADDCYDDLIVVVGSRSVSRLSSSFSWSGGEKNVPFFFLYFENLNINIFLYTSLSCVCVPYLHLQIIRHRCRHQQLQQQK